MTDIHEAIETLQKFGKNSEEGAEYFSNLVTEFRTNSSTSSIMPSDSDIENAPDLRLLMPLITHSDQWLAGLGAYIASEVNDNRGRRGRVIINELSSLFDSPDSGTRFEAISGVARSLLPENQTITYRLLRLTADISLGVRAMALRYSCFLSNAVIGALPDTPEYAVTKLLLPDASKEDILTAIQSKDLFEQRMGITGALRNYGNDAEFMEEILPLVDDEIVERFERLPKASVWSDSYF